MNEKNYKKRLEIQNKIISRQSEHIKNLEEQVRSLILEIEEKNRTIGSIAHLKDELAQNVEEVKKHKKEFEELISELRKMKDIVNKEVYKNRWKLIRFLIK